MMNARAATGWPRRPVQLGRPNSGARAGHAVVGWAAAATLLLTGCFDWVPRGSVHAEGEVRDRLGRPLVGVEVRLLKFWPVRGDSVREPPSSVLFAEVPQAPPGADYGVELVAVAATDRRGTFDMRPAARDVADPRYRADARGRVLTAQTVLVIRPSEPGLDGYGIAGYPFRFGGWYLHHCEFFDAAGPEAAVTVEGDRIHFGFAAGALRTDVPRRSNRFDHRVVLESDGFDPLVLLCVQDRGLDGCEWDGDRIRVTAERERLRLEFDAPVESMQARLITAGPLMRGFARFAPPPDPTWGGLVQPPEDPGEDPPGPDPTDPPGPDPTDPMDPPGPDPTDPIPPGPDPMDPPDPDPMDPMDPSEPGPLPLQAVWAVGPDARVDLSGTAAVDGDPLTRYVLAEEEGFTDALYVRLGDVRLLEAGVLNALVDGIEDGCLVVETTPSVYRTLHGAIGGSDWTGSGRFCGPTGGRGEVSAVQRFDTTQVDGRRAGWMRIRPASGALRLRAVGEVVAFGRPG